MPGVNIIPLHNKYFFRSLIEIMAMRDTNMIIDGSNTLWHLNDVTAIYDSYQSKESTSFIDTI